LIQNNHNDKIALYNFYKVILVVIIILFLGFLVVLNSNFTKVREITTTMPISFVAEPKPVLKAELVECSYRYYDFGPSLSRFLFFFRIINIGDTPTRLPAQIHLYKEGKGSNGHILQRVYGKDEILWGEIDWTSGNKGQEWYWFVPSREDFSYKLIYCENCKGDIEKGGLVIYDGNTYGCRSSSLEQKSI